ncbi:gene transfer agent family protein [Roseovarius indicus]|uniref:Uncharacterized protein n=1 Tax=Roseovarius indicus TaxID=540747 RepID=A0A5P3AEI5_9RHOB|nr:gene transfer agent family protein [Roseovarius indicus]QEW26738.1 hypothetical protein RIdsm_02540 [Roseovarius indicus]SFD60849.1 Phage tail tube protein, GTA-gp10 [Roseovarius indicus]
MADVILEWAGKDRLFRLDFGGVLDLEEACGKDPIGAIFLRISSGKFYASDIWHTIRLALIGGGENKVEAKRLMENHFDRTPYTENASIAGEILIALMMGIEDGGANGEATEPEPIRFSEVSQICRTFNMSPHDLRALTYADFVNLVRGFNSSQGPKLEPPSEEEFEEILAKYEPEALQK